MDAVTHPVAGLLSVAMTDDDLFAELYPGLRRFAAVTAPLDMEPDDLVQEAVARALRRGPLHALDNPSAYLRRTMTNLAANHNRGRGRGRRAIARLRAAEDATVSSYPSDLSELDRLRPDVRAVLYLSEVEGLPFAEVADMVGCTEEAARARASRGRRALRLALDEEKRHDG